MSKSASLIIVLFLILLVSCNNGDSNDSGNSGSSDDKLDSPQDITNAIFTKRVSDCADYVGRYSSSVVDKSENSQFSGSLNITSSGNTCTFSSNSIPNHDFNRAISYYSTKVVAINAEYSIARNPIFADTPIDISLSTDHAIFLNGIKLNLLVDACFGVGADKTGCNNPHQPFRYDPASKSNEFGLDLHNANTQIDGTYHYRGNPNAMFHFDSAIESPVIGFAADGYPIYGSYFNDGGTIRKAKSSYQLKTGARSSVIYNYNSYDPGGNYDGRYIDDYEYVDELGDLDKCNGMTIDGNYGYYVTDAYPWVLKCFRGTPHSSFQKSR